MLRLREAPAVSQGHGGEVFSVTFTPDGSHVLSGGWDGHLCVWDVESGEAVGGVDTGPKPVSACAVSPDNKQWLSGTLEGLLTFWDPSTQQPVRRQVAHTRPISMIRFSDDGKTMATSSWDRRVNLWNLEKENEVVPLSGHGDIVAGCCFVPDSERLVSWSYDGTVRLWQVDPAMEIATLSGHEDRVTAAAVSPDGRWLISGSRDGAIKLWDLPNAREVASVQICSEIKGLAFFLDGETLLSVDLEGRLGMFRIPDLQGIKGTMTGLSVHCAELDPTNRCLVLGCGDGRVRFVSVQGLEQAPLLVTPWQTRRRTVTALQRLFGGSTLKLAFEVTCPVCRRSFDLPRAIPGQPTNCPACQRSLRLNKVTRVRAEEPVEH